LHIADFPKLCCAYSNREKTVKARLLFGSQRKVLCRVN
jgi:hypothetical protein